MIDKLKQALFTPILAIKLRYVPLLLIYLAYGAQALTSVALTFWEKENLSLSTDEFLAISVWAYLPWTIKMVVGQLVDVVPLLGSRRKSWVFLGASLMALGYTMLYGMSINSPWVTWIGGEYSMYLASTLVSVVGFVIQDVTADAMSTEVADRSQSEEDIKKELAMIQILGRLSLMISIAIMGGLGGWLADKLEYRQVFLCALSIPLISIVGAILVKLDSTQEKAEFSPIILGGGIAFAVFSGLMAFSDIAYSQEIIFFVSFFLLSFMLHSLLKNQPSDLLKVIVFSFIAIFIFRATPVVGPGYSWWSIDVLGFDQSFFGVLKTISGFTALAFLWFTSSYIASQPIRAVLLLLIIIGAVFEIPNLMLYYGIHESLGVSARTIALFDTVMESPLAHISMIPMLAVIAYYAPAGKRATWFAVAASMMNLALTASQLGSKYLNKLFIVTREIKDDAGLVVTPQDYSELGGLLWCVILISLIVPYIAVTTLLKPIPKTRSAEPS